MPLLPIRKLPGVSSIGQVRHLESFSGGFSVQMCLLGCFLGEKFGI